MSLSNASETALLALIFNATTWNDIAENDTTGPLTSLYVALHTGDPGEGGTQTTNECAYTSYARVAVVRTSGGWTVSGNQVSNTAAITFPAATGGSETATYYSVGHATSGASAIISSGALTAGLAISSGITPAFAIGALVITVD